MGKSWEIERLYKLKAYLWFLYKEEILVAVPHGVKSLFIKITSIPTAKR